MRHMLTSRRMAKAYPASCVLKDFSVFRDKDGRSVVPENVPMHSRIEPRKAHRLGRRAIKLKETPKWEKDPHELCLSCSGRSIRNQKSLARLRGPRHLRNGFRDALTASCLCATTCPSAACYLFLCQVSKSFRRRSHPLAQRIQFTASILIRQFVRFHQIENPVRVYGEVNVALRDIAPLRGART